MGIKHWILQAFFAAGLIAISSAAKANAYTPRDAVYQKYSMAADRALQLTSGRLNITSSEIPSTAEAAWRLFSKVCSPNVRNDRYAKTLTVEQTRKFTILNFQCDYKNDFAKEADTIQFIVTLDQQLMLADLQILQLSTDTSHPANVKTDDASDVLLKVGAGTLIDGLVSKDQANAENGAKILNSVAGSLVAVSTAALAYKGWNITKKQAYWIGVASGVVTSMLKGAYDSRNTIDASDGVTHGSGFIPNNIDIRFKISF